jgi:hypothetical protein
VSSDKIDFNYSGRPWQNTGIDFSAVIIKRFHGLLNRLLPLLSSISHLWSKPPTLQNSLIDPLITHADWLNSLIERISSYYTLPNCAVRYERKYELSPLSFIWFDLRRWLNRDRQDTEPQTEYTMDEAAPTSLSQLISDAITGRFLPPSYSSFGLFKKPLLKLSAKAMRLPGHEASKVERNQKSIDQVSSMEAANTISIPTGLPESFLQPQLPSLNFMSTYDVEPTIVRPVVPTSPFLGADFPHKFILPVIPMTKSEQTFNVGPLAAAESESAIQAMWAMNPEILGAFKKQPPKMLFHMPNIRTAQTPRDEETQLYGMNLTASSDQYITATPFENITPPVINIRKMHGPIISEPIAETVGYLVTNREQPPLSGYNNAGNRELSLALAPVGRSLGANANTTSPPEASNQAPTSEPGKEDAIDNEELASEVYAILKHRLLVERERAQGIS